MKIRLYLVCAGLIVGLVIKWGLGSISAQTDADDDVTSAAQDTYEPSRQADPLVPPIQVAGLLPPLAGPEKSGLVTLNPLASVDAFGHDPRALFHAHGEEVCASGCAASRHPTEELTEANLRQLIDQYASQPITEDSMALETLLYFGRQTREMLGKMDRLSLDPLRASVLARELAVTHARISIRLLDEDGEVRSWLPPTSVPFDRRHVFDMETANVQPLVTSGTVKRVGLYHLWTRL